MAKSKNVLHQRFGRLTVVEPLPYNPKFRCAAWRCRCDCGNTVDVRSSGLLRGHTRSCGCLASDTAKALLTTHGASRTRAYRAWGSMFPRCYDASHQAWPNYGGRGILVCERWHSFENFLEDMGQPPKGLSLDRVNNAGDYEPSNCRWAAKDTQGRNRRTNRVVEHDGVALTLSEWSERTGIGLTTIKKRLDMGWSPAKALTNEVRPY